jgi:tripartite-type tricarboxylate transporter receptor subunit TctC
VKEFIDYARARPDEVFYGMAGIGTSGHQHAEMFNNATGLKLKGVNYKSAADVMNDIIGGRIHMMFVSTGSSRPAVEAGQLRLLAYADSNLPPESLKAPTLAEAGVPNMEAAQTWWAVFGPPALPADIKRKLNAAIVAAQKDPEFARCSRAPARRPRRCRSRTRSPSCATRSRSSRSSSSRATSPASATTAGCRRS